jgi:hypothetical protein
MATSAQRLRMVVAVAGLAAALTGCSSGHEEAVATTVHRFYAALSEGNASTACGLLAPETRTELEQSTGQPCEDAILAEAVRQPGEEQGLDVFGTMATVRFTGDTAFLAEFDDGWRVMATACHDVPGKPYDCKVKGG